MPSQIQLLDIVKNRLPLVGTVPEESNRYIVLVTDQIKIDTLTVLRIQKIFQTIFNTANFLFTMCAVYPP
jgi:hypothetical protein